MSSPWVTSHAEGHMCARLPEGCGRKGCQNPKGPCGYMGYIWALKSSSRYMGTSLGPKYIPYTYMDPLGKALRTCILRLSGQKTIL